MDRHDAAENIPFERFSSRRIYYAFDFLPRTEDILYSSNTSGQFNLWRQAPPPKNKHEQGASRQLTGFDEWTIRYIAVDPRGKFTLVFADKDGDENYQLFLVDNESGWQRELVMKPGVRNSFGSGCLSPDGKLAAYSSNERTPKYTDIVLTKIPSGETRPVLTGESVNLFGEWSPDGRSCTVAQATNSTDDNNVLLLDTKTGKTRNLTPHKDRANYQPCSWDEKGDGFYVISNEGREFFGMAYLATKPDSKLKWIETPDYDIEDVSLSPNGKILAWISNQDGYSFIHLREVRTGRTLGRPIHTGGVLYSGWFENSKLIKFSPDSKKLLFQFSTPTQPLDLYVLTIADRKLTRYTYGFIGNVPEKLMSKPTAISYESFDRKIPALLYKPTAIQANERIPVVVFVHGGPEAQERPWYVYAGSYQHLLSKGVAIMALNIRGSTGYGRSYRRLIHHDWGGGELNDIENAAKFLRTLDWVDPNRIGICGGSFGGFATLEAVTRLPDYWSVAVDIFGPSNLVTFAKAVPEDWKPFMADLLGDPVRETEFLLSRSPITYLKSLRCPILIIQGANDPRVVKNESDQIVERLRQMGREVEYIVFPDEGHGFTKRKNEFVAWKKANEFLLSHLIGESARSKVQEAAALVSRS